MPFLPITIEGKGAANILCHGKYMPHLHLSSRALKVLDTSRQLFNQDGFHNVGVDRIIESSNIAKGTFYKYFQSKEQLVEICLAFQRNLLKEEVRSLIHTHKRLSVDEKLERIFFLHADLDGLYHLLFKAIFEIKIRYPDAYAIVLEYRSWLVEEVYQLLLVAHANASKVDAEMFLFVVDGAVVQLLGGCGVDKGEWLKGWLVRVWR
ncbi:TetR family transcriptional regulator [Acinetobacter sp. BIGb0102]|nr:TetR family transcriptional regulator [Acinetobacter sp. BIGb0102]